MTRSARVINDARYPEHYCGIWKLKNISRFISRFILRLTILDLSLDLSLDLVFYLQFWTVLDSFGRFITYMPQYGYFFCYSVFLALRDLAVLAVLLVLSEQFCQNG